MTQQKYAFIKILKYKKYKKYANATVQTIAQSCTVAQDKNMHFKETYTQSFSRNKEIQNIKTIASTPIQHP